MNTNMDKHMYSVIDNARWRAGFLHVYQLLALEALGEVLRRDRAANCMVLFSRATGGK